MAADALITGAPTCAPNPLLQADVATLSEVAGRYETALQAVEATLFAIEAGDLLSAVPEGCDREHNLAVIMLGVLLGMVNKLLTGPDADLDIRIKRLASRS